LPRGDKEPTKENPASRSFGCAQDDNLKGRACVLAGFAAEVAEHGIAEEGVGAGLVALAYGAWDLFVACFPSPYGLG